MLDELEKKLKESSLSANTREAYYFAVKQYREKYGDCVAEETLAQYKSWLMDHFSVKTVNLRIRGMNYYLETSGRSNMKITYVKVQQKPFLENVISEADYRYLIQCLYEDGYMMWYFVVRFMTSTGARVSEVVKIKAEHVQSGFIDLYSKGGKLRRIYIPQQLCDQTLKWLKQSNIHSGFLFLNHNGKQLTTRGIASRLKDFAIKYGIDPAVVYPHSFRHRFAKNFLDRCNNIALLADLMGHESIETTRIYLRKTATEQKALIDEIVDW